MVIDPEGFGTGIEFVATGDADGILYLWHRAGDGGSEDSWRVIGELKGGHQGPILAMEFNYDLGHLISGGDDGKLTAWDVMETADSDGIPQVSIYLVAS